MGINCLRRDTMNKDHVGNPYHLDEKTQHQKEIAEEKTLNHIYHVLDEILSELKSIHKRLEEDGKQ